MAFPMLSKLISQLFKKPVTNHFPAKHLPPSVTDFIKEVEKGNIEIHPPAPVATGDFKGQLAYDRETCTGCGLCSKTCPANAFVVFKKEKRVVLYSAQCIQCGQCTEICPRDCLKLSDNFMIADSCKYAEHLLLK